VESLSLIEERTMHVNAERNTAGSGGCTNGDQEKRRVMIVDDEENILSALRRVLRRENYELVTAQSGEQALQLLEAKPAQLIVADHRMPGMTGIEFLREVRRRWPDCIRLILSGYAEATTIIAAINEGEIYKFITKPWNDEQIRLDIRRAIEQYELEAENRRMACEILEQNNQLRELNGLLDQRAADASTGLTLAQELLESIDVGVLTVDETGLIVGANRRAVHIVHAGRPGLIGMPAHVVLPVILYETMFSDELSAHVRTEGRLTFDGNVLQWRIRSLGDNGNRRGKVMALWEEVE